MSQSIDAAILKRIRAFPTMSASATRAMQILREPSADASEIEKVLGADPGLTANLLRLANSSYFASSGTIGSVRDAVVRLGTERVFRLVVTSSVNATPEPAVAGYETQPGEMRRHAVAVSVAADCIVKQLGWTDAGGVFTAALLHDVGKFVLGEFLQKELGRVTAVAAGGASFDQAERQVLGVDHAEIGGMILERWSLPPDLVSVVRWHHHPEALDPPERFVDVVHAADMLCMALGYDEGREGLHYRISPTVKDRLGIVGEQLDVVAMEVLEAVDELCSSLEGAGGATRPETDARTSRSRP